MKLSAPLPRMVFLCALAVLAGTACERGARAQPDLPNPPGAGGIETSAAPSQATATPSADLSEDGGGSGAGEQATEDDMKVFGYATSDEAAIAAAVVMMAETADELVRELEAGDVSAAEDTAGVLLGQAEALQADADRAADRQRPLDPSDPTLRKARENAIEAFALTADYADAVADVARAALTLSLSELISVANEVASLEGTGDEIEQAYADLTRELQSWAEDHPAEAAMALARYGA